MKIIGNKICPVCHELNSKTRKECTKCKCILEEPINDGTYNGFNKEFKFRRNL